MREREIVIRVRTIDVAAVVSILLHALFFTLMPHKAVTEPPGPQADAPLNVVLAPPQAEPAQPAAPAPAPAPSRAPPVIARIPAPLPPRFPPPPLAPPVAAPSPIPVPEARPAPQVD